MNHIEHVMILKFATVVAAGIGANLTCTRINLAQSIEEQNDTFFGKTEIPIIFQQTKDIYSNFSSDTNSILQVNKG